MAADLTSFPIQTATIAERAASNPATLPLGGDEAVLLTQAGETKGATAEDIAATLPDATPSDAGKMTAADKTKLDSVASGATANATDAALRDRATHTGTQAIATVTGLQAALDGKATAAQGALADTATQPGDLGTAAALDSGTGAGNVVALDGSARLPAVDGSQLTNLPSGGATNLDGLTDVAVTTPATDQVLKYNGSVWVNAAATDDGGYPDDNYAIPSGVLEPQATGPTIEVLTSATNGIKQRVATFSGVTTQTANFSDTRPKNWSGANPTARFRFRAADGATGAATFAIAITAINEGDVVDVAPTFVQVNDGLMTAGRDQLTEATAAIPIQGALQANSRLQFWIRRNKDDAADTMSANCHLISTIITFASA